MSTSLDIMPHIIHEKISNENMLRKHITDKTASNFSNSVSTKMHRLANIDDHRIKLINNLDRRGSINVLGIAEVDTKICIEFNDGAKLASEHPGLCIAFNRYKYRKGIFSQFIFDCQFWFIKCPFTIIHFFALRFKHIIDIICSLQELQIITQIQFIQRHMNTIIQYYEVNILNNIEILQRYVVTATGLLEARYIWGPLVVSDTKGHRPRMLSSDLIDQGIVGIAKSNVKCKRINDIVRMKYKSFNIIACDFRATSTQDAIHIIKRQLSKSTSRSIIGIITKKKKRLFENIRGLKLISKQSNLIVLATTCCNITYEYQDTGVIGLVLESMIHESLTPKSLTPKSLTPKSLTPKSLTPNPNTELLEGENPSIGKHIESDNENLQMVGITRGTQGTPSTSTSTPTTATTTTATTTATATTTTTTSTPTTSTSGTPTTSTPTTTTTSTPGTPTTSTPGIPTSTPSTVN